MFHHISRQFQDEKFGNLFSVAFSVAPEWNNINVAARYVGTYYTYLPTEMSASALCNFSQAIFRTLYIGK